MVTGAAGFVGANLARRLVTEGERVTAFCRPGGSRWRLDGIAREVDVVEVDLRDAESVVHAVAAARPDRVYHLAAYGAYSWQENARQMVETNVLGTMNVVDACVASSVEALVHAGSSSEYGLKDHAPSEQEPVEPNSDYAVSKVAATLHCRRVARETGGRVAILRLYSVYGPWEEPRRLVPTLVAQALRGSLPPLVGPDVARDFVYVDDAVEAFLLAAELPGDGPGAVYNVGSGEQTAIRELAEIARTVFRIRDEPVFGSMENRSWDTDVWLADARRIQASLGWRASVPLEEGLRRTAEWLRGASDRLERYTVDASSIGRSSGLLV